MSITTSEILYPGLFPFGTSPLPRLARADEAAARFEDRLMSVWPFLMLKAKKFVKRLHPREQANYDVEDVLQEVVVALRTKDDKWDSGRAAYITFAGMVMGNVLVMVREKNRVVEAPLNAASRLKKYRALDGEGRLTARQKLTLEALERAMEESESLGVDDDQATDSDATSEMAKGENIDALRDMAKRAMRSLEVNEAIVLGRTYGLFGASPLSDHQIARLLPRPCLARDVASIRESALARLHANQGEIMAEKRRLKLTPPRLREINRLRDAVDAKVREQGREKRREKREERRIKASRGSQRS